MILDSDYFMLMSVMLREYPIKKDMIMNDGKLSLLTNCFSTLGHFVPNAQKSCLQVRRSR